MTGAAQSCTLCKMSEPTSRTLSTLSTLTTAAKRHGLTCTAPRRALPGLWVVRVQRGRRHVGGAIEASPGAALRAALHAAGVAA